MCAGLECECNFGFIGADSEVGRVCVPYVPSEDAAEEEASMNDSKGDSKSDSKGDADSGTDGGDSPLAVQPLPTIPRSTPASEEDVVITKTTSSGDFTSTSSSGGGTHSTHSPRGYTSVTTEYSS